MSRNFQSRQKSSDILRLKISLCTQPLLPQGGMSPLHSLSTEEARNMLLPASISKVTQQRNVSWRRCVNVEAAEMAKI